MRFGFGLAALAFALLVGVAVVGAGSAAAADGPQWVTSDEENNTTVSPGQQLAGAVGAQGATVEGELWNRSLSGRLDEATTAGDRAAVLADEIDTIGEYVDALETARENLTASREAGELSEGEYRASLSGFVIRARSVERRANRTARAAEELSPATRERYGVNVTRAENLSARAHGLYQFDDEVSREVVNETLENDSGERELPVGDADSDSDLVSITERG